MNWKSSKLNILFLDSKDKEVLSLLKDPLSLQELSRKSPIPRTTLAFIIKNLIKRNFIEKVKFGKRCKYYSISEEKLQSYLEDTRRPLSKGKFHTSLPTNLPVSKNILGYQGLKNIIRMQADFLNSYQNERVYAIQPNKSWLSLHFKVSVDRIIHVNNLIRNNNLIVEAIIEHDAYRNFKRVNKNKVKFIEFTKSFSNRMADYVSAPEGFLTDQVEMWIIKNTVLFIDWKKEMAIKIVDEHIVGFLRNMFLLAKAQGKRMDHNQAIREILN